MQGKVVQMNCLLVLSQTLRLDLHAARHRSVPDNIVQLHTLGDVGRNLLSIMGRDCEQLICGHEAGLQGSNAAIKALQRPGC